MDWVQGFQTFKLNFQLGTGSVQKHLKDYFKILVSVYICTCMCAFMHACMHVSKHEYACYSMRLMVRGWESVLAICLVEAESPLLIILSN